MEFDLIKKAQNTQMNPLIVNKAIPVGAQILPCKKRQGQGKITFYIEVNWVGRLQIADSIYGLQNFK